ncbi:MAG TPA: hypothetical protein VIR16_10720 [Candidatus Limnocylindrales bacterium]
MVRTVQIALAAVAVLAAGCIALLTATDADAQSPAPAKLAAPVQAPAVPAAVAAPAVRRAPVASAPVAPAAPAEEKDAFEKWSPSIAKLPKDLGEVGPSLKLALDDARNNDMAFCFRELDQRADGAEAAPRTLRATDFVLYIETREGTADVVEAKVARPGTLPQNVVDCARDVLRGLEVKVYFASPGAHFSYIYEIEA